MSKEQTDAIVSLAALIVIGLIFGACVYVWHPMGTVFVSPPVVMLWSVPW